MMMMSRVVERKKSVVDRQLLLSEVSKVSPLFTNGGGSSSYGPSSPVDSPSSSSFSNGFCSPDDGGGGSPYYMTGRVPDSKRSCLDGYNNGELVDELGLGLCRMSVRGGEEHNIDNRCKGFGMDPFWGFGESLEYNVKRCGPPPQLYRDDLDNVAVGSLSSDDGFRCNFNGFGKRGFDSMGSSFVSHNLSNSDVVSGSSQGNYSGGLGLEQRNEQSSFWNRTYCEGDALLYAKQCEMNSSSNTVLIDPLSSSCFAYPRQGLASPDPYYKTLVLEGKNRTVTDNCLVPQPLVCTKNSGNYKACCSEDTLIMDGETLNPVSYTEPHAPRACPKNYFNEIAVRNLIGKRVHLESVAPYERFCQSNQRLNNCNKLPMTSSVSSLCEFRGCVYLMAQDQDGCRFLQRVFEEGMTQDVEIIFNELIDHVIELTLKPFGNYVIQKLLDVCSAEQRLQIILMVTKQPGQLVNICLNTYGTRVVQKLIETIKTRQEIAIVMTSMKPGFLDLIKDQNGNHVIQRCLQCLNNEDIKFIFDGAAKFCVEIATHRHGCCVMQRCISYASGRYRYKLMTEISKSGLALAQDPFGNYVIQYIIELKSSSATANLISQFKGHYVHLSLQKFSSHVVEKCLKHLEESRFQIVRELLSVSHFEQLLQDQFANYVIQSALHVVKGPIRSMLVEAVRPHNVLRTSPYCKRIFSRNLLRN